MEKTNLNFKIERAGAWLILCFVVCLATACTNKPVATVESEAEAIQIVTVLREYDIASEKEAIGDEKNRQFNILLESGFMGGDEHSSAYQILNDHCLPHREPAPIADGGFIASNEAEKAKVQRQLKISIISQLQKLPGVTCVDVNFVQPQDQLAAVNPYPATASVIVNRKNQEVDFNVQDVKNLVASSVPNLQPDKVTAVLMFQPVRPIVKVKSNMTQKLLLIGGAGLVIVIGAVLLVYFMQKRRQRSTSTALERTGEFENAEPVES